MNPTDYDEWAALVPQFCTPPTPSLCDTCMAAYLIPGGTVGVGRACYAQRYCTTFTKAIHMDGAAECEGYVKRPEDPS